MDHYADDLAAVTTHLDLHNAVHIGHSTGGGEVVRYIARHGESHVAKAVLISSVPPLMVQTGANPGGLPKSLLADRLHRDLKKIPVPVPVLVQHGVLTAGARGCRFGGGGQRSLPGRGLAGRVW